MRVCWKKNFLAISARFPCISSEHGYSHWLTRAENSSFVKNYSNIFILYTIRTKFQGKREYQYVDLYPHPVFWKWTTSQSSTFWEWVYHFVKFIHFLTETFLPCPIPSPINIRSQVLYCLQKPRWEKDLDEY